MAAAEGPLLEFEAEMFSSLFADDGLLVAAEGMGVDRVALQFLRLYSAQVGGGGGAGGSLVLVLNASAPQQEHFTEQLRGEGVVLPGVLTGDVLGTARRDAYHRGGGVLFVSSRVLVADLLTDRVPAHLVSGVLVCRAHRLAESSWCQEAFALRLFRQKNKTGFIKAFTDRAAAFSSGFCRADRVMRSLFVRKLYLWPRFQASVRAALDDGRNKPEVVELRVALTPAMRAIQSAVLDVMGACLKELKRYHPALEAEEDLTLENLLLQGENALENAVRHYLDPLWHQLGAQTKGLVHDLKTLRFLLLRLTEYDCVTFLNLLESLHAAQRNFGTANSSSGGWLFLDSCTSMFVNARSRVYRVSERRKRLRVASAAVETGRKQTSEACTEVKRELVLEKSPKWEALSEVLREIETENQSSEEEPGRVLICASDDRACAQLQRYVRRGADALLRRLYERTAGKRDAAASAAFAAALELDTERAWTRKRRPPEKASKEKNASQRKTSNSESGPSPTQTTGTDEDIRRDGTERTSGSTDKDGLTDDEKDEEDEELKLDLSSDDCYGLRKEPTMVIHPLRGCSDPYGLTRVLRQVAPRFVVLYDADLGFVRQLEIYAAGRPAGRPPLRVYFLVYAGSTEEQRYLTALSREKKAFEQLIREKATMVGPEEREGREEDTNLDLARSLEPTAAVDTRRAGGQEEPRRPGEEQQRPRVVVDMRELGSELPSLLHRRGLDLQPVTLAVGDYVLADDTCVERKSVSDLIGSLRSGRLYGQCLAMTRYYKRAVLMIEFDTAARPFFSLAAPLMAGPRSSSSSSSYPQQEMLSATDVTSRLALLTLHFPRLRMAWCASPRAAAELFREMKRGRPEPDVVAAQAMGVAGGEDDVVDSATTSDLYNPGPYDLLLKMPGVDGKNYRALVSHADSLADLATFSQDRLARILGNASNARLLYGFLHSAADVPAAPAQKSRHA